MPCSISGEIWVGSNALFNWTGTNMQSSQGDKLHFVTKCHDCLLCLWCAEIVQRNLIGIVYEWKQRNKYMLGSEFKLFELFFLRVESRKLTREFAAYNTIIWSDPVCVKEMRKWKFIASGKPVGQKMAAIFVWFVYNVTFVAGIAQEVLIW